ncbi:MAG: response regulator transcription factor [Solirubrobacterales bacterium]
MPKILIVDDEPHIRLLLEQTLEEFEDQGIDILKAENGRQALDLIQREKPDLVYLDVMMPEMNGYEVCRTVKFDMKLDDIFIVLLTAKGQEFDKKKGLEVGANIYVTKPFDPDFIVEKTREVLKV